MTSTRAEEFRTAVKTAIQAAKVAPNDPFLQVLQDLAQGIEDENIRAEITREEYSGRLSLQIAPAYRPSRAVTMLVVLLRGPYVEVLLNPRQKAANPEELTNILKAYIGTPDFLESLQEIGRLVLEPVEGFLRSRPSTVSHRDVMLTVSPAQQKQIAENIGKEVSLSLPISTLPGAGKFDRSTQYKVLDSAGFSVELSTAPVEDKAGNLQIVGKVGKS